MLTTTTSQNIKFLPCEHPLSSAGEQTLGSTGFQLILRLLDCSQGRNKQQQEPSAITLRPLFATSALKSKCEAGQEVQSAAATLRDKQKHLTGRNKGQPREQAPAQDAATGQGGTAPEHSRQSRQPAPSTDPSRASSKPAPGSIQGSPVRSKRRQDPGKHCNTGPETTQKSWLKDATGDKPQHTHKAGIQETSCPQHQSKAHQKGQTERCTYSRAKAGPKSELIWSSGPAPWARGCWEAPGEAS